jgi:CheY-like chemotaxis protein
MKKVFNKQPSYWKEAVRQLAAKSALKYFMTNSKLLNYKIPQMNGLEVAKEILAVNPHQRMILASDYLRGTLLEAVEKLNRMVEVLYKPFSV